MGLRLLPLLAFALLAAACAAGAGAERAPPAAAGVTLIADRSSQGPRVRLNETVTRSTYSVDGVTVPEIRSHLVNEAAAGGSDGKRYDGLTTWAVHWTFRYDHGGAACSLANATIDVSIDVRLPRLSDAAVIAPDILDRWQAYAAALEAHEMGHVDRESAVIDGLKDAFESAGPASDCSSLGDALNSLGNDYVQQVRIADAAYDAETNHGQTQGAVFP
ncbi:MAG TPA: DUF922 domain-containing protein [Dehalococcoidia bacterium]|jgi:predicted secreted Zn-dependent protease